MTEEPKTNHWWQTVPGVLTALATVLTAVTGMVVALGQVGLFKPSTPPPAASSSPASLSLMKLQSPLLVRLQPP